MDVEEVGITVSSASYPTSGANWSVDRSTRRVPGVNLIIHLPAPLYVNSSILRSLQSPQRRSYSFPSLVFLSGRLSAIRTSTLTCGLHLSADVLKVKGCPGVDLLPAQGASPQDLSVLSLRLHCLAPLVAACRDGALRSTRGTSRRAPVRLCALGSISTT